MSTAPEPLEERPADDEDGEGAGQRGHRRAAAVDDAADDEGPLPAEDLPDLAAGDHERRHDQRVEGDGRLDAGHRRPDVLGHGGDGHVHDRAVEGHEELGGAQGEEDEAATTGSLFRGGGSVGGVGHRVIVALTGIGRRDAAAFMARVGDPYWDGAAGRGGMADMRVRPDPVGPGMESVWDYPRPPRLERTARRIRVELAGTVIVDTTAAYRVLETSHPPNYYVPPDDVAAGVLVRASGNSFCEWKGQAHYFDVRVGDRLERAAAWGYDRPTPPFAAIAGFVGVLPGPHGRLLRRRRAGGAPAGRFLRGLGHVRHRRAGQGRAREPGLVARRLRCLGVTPPSRDAGI